MKKSGSLLREESKIKRFLFIQANSIEFSIARMCKVLEVSTSGYYAWIKRPKVKRDIENACLLEDIKTAFYKSNKVFGSRQVKRQIEKTPLKDRCSKLLKINHKRIERLMRENGMQSKTKEKYKVTTNSNHDLPVAENILNRDFVAEAPNQKLVSDITYVATDEGWLYVAGVMDLCGGVITGLSMSDRMTKEYGYICSMSRKGNCWDNAPMESFWGKLKQEWLNEHIFKTRKEAKAKVFEYIMVFYNRKRPPANFDYMTPEECYNKKLLANAT